MRPFLAVVALTGVVSLGGTNSGSASPRIAGNLEFELSHEVAGRRGGRLLVVLALTVDSRGLGRTTIGGVEVARLAVRGEVSRARAPLENFEYSFTLPVEEDRFPIVVERELRPGEYDVRVELRDLITGRSGERVFPLRVAVPVSLLSPAPDGADQESRPLRKILLVAPEGDALAGLQEFTAAADGQVARVQFLLDGTLVVTRNRPPFKAPIDLGPLPRAATVTAVALDDDGREVDRAQIVVNQGRERFAVRLEPITPADRRGNEVRLRAAVNVPSERRLERVEFFLGEVMAATVATPPFEAWVPLGGDTALARAVAVLDDGAQAEDISLLGAVNFATGVRVDAVELPVTVLGPDGRPVEHLQRDDFEVFEDGVLQRLTHVARHGDVPVRVGLVLDTSGSMEKTLGEVQRVALGFLRNLLRPTDRAFVVAFSDRPVLLQPMTREFDALGRSLLGLRAEGPTALYDAVVFSLFQFSGVRGRRALVVLTDGADNASQHTCDHVVELAARTAAVVYAIGIDLGPSELRTRAGLQRLARATGGEAFFVARGGSLERVYGRIERELRSQYVLAYTSASNAPPGQWRRVEVRVRRPGAKVRTLPGYVPQ